MESYVERAPWPGLAGAVRTVWVQRTGEAPYPQRHLPTGGVEIHFPIGHEPRLVGPLTRPEVEVIPAHTTVVGVRFHPGTAPPMPMVLDDLVDQHDRPGGPLGNSGGPPRGGDGSGRDARAGAHVAAGPPGAGVSRRGTSGSAGARSRTGADALAPGPYRYPRRPPGAVDQPAAPPLPARGGSEPEGASAHAAVPRVPRPRPSWRYGHWPTWCRRHGRTRGRCGVRRPGTPQPRVPAPDRPHSAPAPRRQRRPVRLRPRARRVLPPVPRHALHATAGP